MPGVIRKVWTVLVDAANGWMADDAMSMGASIAFYTIFSLAPTFILATAIAGLVFGDEAARGALVGQLANLVGEEAAKTVQGLVASANNKKAGFVASALGVVTLLVGATTVFAELQSALNRIWKAQPPSGSTLTWIVKMRLKGLALIGAIGFLLIVSLVVSTLLAAFSTWANRYLPDIAGLLWVVEALTFWIAFTVLFALIYRVLPDTRIPWRDVRLGAAVTALLFLIGKFLIGLYLGTSGVTTTYGAAGSFVLVLMWVYYSTTIFLFGAEITRAYSKRYGSRRPLDEQIGDTNAHAERARA